MALCVVLAAVALLAGPSCAANINRIGASADLLQPVVGEHDLHSHARALALCRVPAAAGGVGVGDASAGPAARITILSGTGVGGDPLRVRMAMAPGKGVAGAGALPSFELELTREAFAAPSHAQGADGKHTPVSLADHLFYAGHVVGSPGSSSVRMRGVKAPAARSGAPPLPAALFGTIHQGADVWVVEPVDGDDHDESTPPAMLMRHKDDIELVDANFGTCDHSADGHSDDDDDDEHHPHGANASSARARRAGPAAGHTQCNIFLDADKTYFDQWKGTCPSGWSSTKCTNKQIERVTIKMVDVLHLSDNIWSSDGVLKRFIKLVVAGTNVQTARSGDGLPDMRVHGTDSSGLLSSYGKWLATGADVSSAYDYPQRKWIYTTTMPDMRGGGAPKANEVCTNHLFTHVDFGTGTLGVASLRAICTERPYERSFSDGKAYYISNVGFTTTLSRGRSAPQWQAVLTAAHELGHNFGASHDCCSSCSTQQLEDQTDQICPGYSSSSGYTFSEDHPLASCVP